MNSKSKEEKKLLLVTFPVDLGSTTWEKLLEFALREHVDLKIYRFSPSLRQVNQKKHKHFLIQRLLCIPGLWKEIIKAQIEGRKILFQGISPALYSYPVNFRRESFIILDWTRKLYDTLPSPPLLTYVHSKILESQKCVIGVTSAVVDGLVQDYQVSKDKVKKAAFPFSSNLDLFLPSSKRDDQEVRILFVGGDFHRKGGDVLLQWFKQQNNSNIKLTILTKSNFDTHSNLSVKNNVEFGEEEHISIFKDHDIFALPTKCDAYPTVLGEAACAGLAILTTKRALGAPEIVKNDVNGYICESQEELLRKLEELAKNKEKIESMKIESRKHMEREFNVASVIMPLIQYIFND